MTGKKGKSGDRVKFLHATLLRGRGKKKERDERGVKPSSLCRKGKGKHASFSPLLTSMSRGGGKERKEEGSRFFHSKKKLVGVPHQSTARDKMEEKEEKGKRRNLFPGRKKKAPRRPSLWEARGGRKKGEEGRRPLCPPRGAREEKNSTEVLISSVEEREGGGGEGES